MDDKKLREIEELIRDAESNGASLVNIGFASALIAEVARLQGEGDKLREVIDNLTSNHADEILRLQAELDAAKMDMKECPSNPCKICKQSLCMACNAYPDYERFEWRGVKGE